MSTKLSTIRAYQRDKIKVEIAEHVEYTHPSEMIATGDEQADAEYVRKVETGEYPWYTLGVHVFARAQNVGRTPVWREIGSAYLGCCDTVDIHAIGVRDLVREAADEARSILELRLFGLTFERER